MEAELAFPIIGAIATLTNGIDDVGLINTRSTIRPLAIETLVVALFSLLIAWSVRYVLRVLPFAALERILANLEDSHEQLKVEIAAKEVAFEEQRKLSAAMNHQVTHDTLTGLPNRSFFNFKLIQMVEQAQNNGEVFAVMIVDLNRFKEINLSHADIAMQYAKQRATTYSVYDFSYDSNNPNRLVLTAELRHAIDNKALELNYQPKVDLKTGETVSVEALARWHHPQLGFVAPDVFIPIAEQAGMINALTEWVVSTAITQLSNWKKLGLKLSIAVNISAHNLHDDVFPQLIKSMLKENNIDPQYLALEITESSIMIDPPKSRALIQGLAEGGIKFSVDDYGTGYSSLAYLKKLTVHELKIDRSFVCNEYAAR